MNLKKLSGGSLALVLLMAGCILSGTFVIEFGLTSATTLFTNGMIKEAVDLSSEEDWEDHKEDIKRIDKITFDAIVQNNLATATTLNVYVSSNTGYTSGADVEAGVGTDVYSVLLGYVTKPSGIDTLTVVEADGLLQLTGANFEGVKSLIEGTNFCVYITSTDLTASGSILEANVYITFTAAL